MQTSEGRVLVFFDLEATGLDTTVCDIIQISAIYGEKVFNSYCLPSKALSESAARVTGFTVKDNKLLLHGNPIPTTPIGLALEAFIEFLTSFNSPVLLVAHSAMRFDAPVLSRVLRQHLLYGRFQEVVYGFLDTFPLSKKLSSYLPSYSLKYLARHYLKKPTFDAHNAVEDARILQEIFRVWNPNPFKVQMCTYRTSRV